MRNIRFFSIVLLVMLIFTSFSTSAFASNILYFNFEEDSGTKAVDASGSGNDGTIQGSVKWIDGKHGKALELDGQQDGSHVVLPTNLLSGKNAFSFAAWIRYDGGSDWSRVFDFHNDVATDDPSFNSMWLTADGFNTADLAVNKSFTFQFNGTDSLYNTETSAPVEAGEWVHVAVTVGDGKVNIYKNGEAVAIETFDGINGWAAVTPAGEFSTTFGELGLNKFLLGESAYPADKGFPGAFDEVYIYDTVLSADEIKGLMAGGENTTTDSAEENSGEETTVENPQTGDQGVMLYLLIALGAALVLFGTLRKTIKLN